MITIKPSGGLANRMRALDSALSLGAVIDRPVRIRWPLTPECNCSFKDLFELPVFAEVEEVREGICQNPLARKGFFLLNWIACSMKYDCVLHRSRLLRWKARKYDFTALVQYRSVYIQCCDRFFYPKRRYAYLLPSPGIEARVNSVLERFSASTVGVHIRRTDSIRAIEHSLVSDFVDAMRAEIERDEAVSFFLATDDAEVESRITDLFGSRIITFSKRLDRNSPEGVQDALVDLLCLSKSRKIFGSFYSSFYQEAAQVGRIPLVILPFEPAKA